jgi:hypothetical protein
MLVYQRVTIINGNKNWVLSTGHQLCGRLENPPVLYVFPNKTPCVWDFQLPCLITRGYLWFEFVTTSSFWWLVRADGLQIAHLFNYDQQF